MEDRLVATWAANRMNRGGTFLDLIDAGWTKAEVDRVVQTFVASRGWTATNAGEARVAAALLYLGFRSSDVEQQFKLGQYRLDFALVGRRIAIESDGWVHTSAPVRKRDRERDEQLGAWGWETIRVDPYEPRLFVILAVNLLSREESMAWRKA